MANSLLTIQKITRRSLSLFLNSNNFLQSIDRQFDAEWQGGEKIGATLKIRLPNDYVSRIGATAVTQNTIEQSTQLTIASMYGVDVSFGSNELSLSIQDMDERILAPMMNTLAGTVAGAIMGGVEGVPNLVHNTSGSATVSPVAATWLAAGAILDINSAPRGDRIAILDPMTMSRTVSSFSGLFNPTESISKQYRTGMLTSNVLGFDFAMDQTVIAHTEGTFTSGTVNGANQSGTTINVNALSGSLNAGDIVTFANVYGTNRVLKNSTGVLQQFVVTTAAASGATSINIYPSLNPPVGGVATAYQTVTASPANSAAIASPVAASETYRKNFVMHPLAATMATANLDLPTGAVVGASRESYSGVSLRVIRDYNSQTDQWPTRFDILMGFTWPRPEWAVIVADAL